MRPLIVAFLALSILLPTATAKDPPTGIYSLLEPHTTDKPLVNFSKRKSWTLPFVDGLVPRTEWNTLEPEEGKYNWAFFDEAVALAQKSNKRLGLSIKAGIATPKWVFSKGADPFEFTLRTNYKTDSVQTMPPIWDPVYQQTWGNFIRALGRRYDDAPEVAHVMIAGPGSAIETYFVKMDSDFPKFRAGGGFAKWLEASKQIVDIYAEAFPKTPFVLAMAPPVTNNKEGEKAIVDLAEYGLNRYPGRFGVMHHGLNATSTIKFKLNEIIATNAARSPAGFQMVWSMQGENAKLVKGTLREALDRAVEMNAQWVDVYAEDCNDPVNTPTLELIRSKMKPGS